MEKLEQTEMNLRRAMLEAKEEMRAPDAPRCSNRGHYEDIIVDGFCRQCGHKFSLPIKENK